MKKARRMITIDNEIELGLRVADFNVSNFCNEALRARLNISKEESIELERLKLDLKEINIKLNKLQEKKVMIIAKIQKAEQEIEEEQKKQEQENIMAIQALKANNPMRNIK